MRISQEQTGDGTFPVSLGKKNGKCPPSVPEFPFKPKPGLSDHPTALNCSFSLRVVECLRGTPSSYSRNSYGDRGE